MPPSFGHHWPPIRRQGQRSFTLPEVLVAITVLQAAHSPNESAKALREAAEFYKVDVAAITVKVKQDFAAKEITKTAKKAAPKPPAKAVKGARAA